MANKRPVRPAKAKSFLGSVKGRLIILGSLIAVLLVTGVIVTWLVWPKPYKLSEARFVDVVVTEEDVTPFRDAERGDKEFKGTRTVKDNPDGKYLLIALDISRSFWANRATQVRLDPPLGTQSRGQISSVQISGPIGSALGPNSGILLASDEVTIRSSTGTAKPERFLYGDSGSFGKTPLDGASFVEVDPRGGLAMPKKGRLQGSFYGSQSVMFLAPRSGLTEPLTIRVFDGPEVPVLIRQGGGEHREEYRYMKYSTLPKSIPKSEPKK